MLPTTHLWRGPPPPLRAFAPAQPVCSRDAFYLRLLPEGRDCPEAQGWPPKDRETTKEMVRRLEAGGFRQKAAALS